MSSPSAINTRGIGFGDETGRTGVGREELHDGARIDFLAVARLAPLARSWASWFSVMSGSVMIASIVTLQSRARRRSAGAIERAWSGPTRSVRAGLDHTAGASSIPIVSGMKGNE